MPIRILLADNHAILRQSLAHLLNTEKDFQVIGEASNGSETVKLIQILKPDVIVLDIAMPEMNGFEVIRHLDNLARRPAIVLLTMYDKAAYVVEALKHPSCSFVLKDDTSDGLVKAIRTTIRGGRYISPSIPSEEIQHYLEQAQDQELNLLDTLTLREMEVLNLVASGLSNYDIALRLAISRRTVEKHREHLMRKLRVQTQADLVRYAILHGVASLEENQ